MPNWVTNNVSVEGSPELLTEIVDGLCAVDGEELLPVSFTKLIPRPADQEENWYEWNVEHWGTKWDACHTDVDGSPADGHVMFTFDTAWSPPMPVFQALVDRWPAAAFTIEYCEEQGWGGQMRCEHGKVVSSRQWDIPESHSTMIEAMGRCECSDDYQHWPDCFAARAEEAGGLTAEQLETIRALGPEWSGSYAEIVAAAKRL